MLNASWKKSNFNFLEYPTEPFAILKSLKITGFYVVQERRAADFEAPQVAKGSVGYMLEVSKRSMLKIDTFKLARYMFFTCFS